MSVDLTDRLSAMFVGLVNHVDRSLFGEARDEIVRLRAENDMLRDALTPSAETKAAYIGEFHFGIRCQDEDGNEVTRRIPVPWDTVKEIMAAIRARAALGDKP
jgi:hypothetical protein